MRRSFFPTLALIVLTASGAYAASTNIDTEVSISQTALAISTTQTVNFGNFEITSSNAQGTIEIDAAGDAIVTGTNIIHTGGSNFGLLLIQGTASAPIEYTCTTFSTLAHETDTAQTINVSSVTVRTQACGGPPITASLGSNGQANAGVRGTLEFSSPIPGNYSSANPGGVPITVDVVYQ